MLRRRLRLSSYSDDEDDEEQQQQTHEGEVQLQEPAVSHRSAFSTSSNPNPNPSEPLEISDDDFLDVTDNLSPPSPLAPVSDQSFQPPPVLRPVTGTDSGESSNCLIGDFLRRLGLGLRSDWLDSCVRGLESSVPGFASFDVAGKAKLCFEQFLYSDTNYSGGGVLPDNVSAMHLVDLAGPFVLQVDEIVSISCPLRGRYQNASSGIKRCLKLSMTDGVQRVFGMEYRPIKDLEVLAPAGLKVAICNVNIRHGLLMLVPEVIEVLGGLVEELDTARQRLVHEVNKPPRGKRTRAGVVPSLATRATLAAWPPNGITSLGQTNSFASQNSTSFPANDQGVRLAASGVDTNDRIVEESANHISGENAATTNPSSDAVLGVEEVRGVDEVEHPVLLAGDREIPFTYLSSLLAKWASMKEKTPFVQGKIKCFLTGVKGFQYKQRAKFELRVYVDDGSLISEILVDHNVVQKGIEHSPEEVTTSLASSDKKVVSDMKETLKKFQIFLLNFEGIILIEMNETSSLPIALEMNQGCPASDAWLLLRRLKSLTSAQTLHHPHLDPINISP